MKQHLLTIKKLSILAFTLLQTPLTAQARDSLESLRNDLNTAATKINALQNQNATQQIQINSLQAQVDKLAPSTIYHIGDMGPAGGIVFYLSDTTGMHGLEAASVDQSNAVWGCYGQSILSDAPFLIEYDGKKNTAMIMSFCQEPGIAAQAVDTYSHNSFDDWYLPSKFELDLMYKNIGRGAAGPLTNAGGFALGYYWSSTESSAVSSWTQGFNTGSQGTHLKNENYNVRAIRTF
ncbi:DUF1566 domain-containing protein [Methylomonas koyamae]|uniref:DUF1566 domain-containing protein n=1 Tax=Methylomonas koyamae TaxID=702114 RepID=UPI0006D2A60A|nr:DUF1566 domain-containing protein [Methylomonas koyamae]BBL58335.1 hypothetical protein MKFW12EY_19480 [Methylomonas koyamae]